ncbi:hypothetical protein AVEN_127299-1 [Araneus ventricosus]|uniref:Uncharacterized protein n=1 Tax=Araneus ventricosus TaxID=182803 RepID=A0A4Y2EGR1_ARAVE|nr:hypothetical protein AVEN_127299-1 [Araneus ventricosus]
MENESLFTNIQEKHVAQVTGTITLVQISNTNRQQFTSNNSNSTLRFRNTNSQQITINDSNSTFNSAQLTGFPARDKTPRRDSHSKGDLSRSTCPSLSTFTTP